MNIHFKSLLLATALLLGFSQAYGNILNLSQYQVSDAAVMQHLNTGTPITVTGNNGQPVIGAVSVVTLRGKTNHFGMDITQYPPQYIDYHATVPDVLVWIPEYPESKQLNVKTDATGWWTMHVVKNTGIDIDVSYIYEKAGWTTTKTNIIPITDEDNTDMALQFIDPLYYQVAMKPYIENMMRTGGYPDFFFDTALVITVGKSWTSMHDDRLPHGDAGATAIMTPEEDDVIGPIYFNKEVQPDLQQPYSSVDGGVAWFNVRPSDDDDDEMEEPIIYSVTAKKYRVNYETVRFRIDPADAANGVELYISSAPDSVESDNTSPPHHF